MAALCKSSKWFGLFKHVIMYNLGSTCKMNSITVTVISGVARPGPTRACALPSTCQALPSPTQLDSRDSTTNQTKVKKIHIYLAVLTAIARSVLSILNYIEAYSFTSRRCHLECALIRLL